MAGLAGVSLAVKGAHKVLSGIIVGCTFFGRTVFRRVARSMSTAIRPKGECH